MGVYDPIDAAASRAYLQGETSTVPGALTIEVSPESAQVSQLPLSEMRIIGEAQQQWAPLRRKYNLFLYRGSAAAALRERAPKERRLKERAPTEGTPKQGTPKGGTPNHNSPLDSTSKAASPMYKGPG